MASVSGPLQRILVFSVVVLVVVVAYLFGRDGSGHREGPLMMTEGHMTNMLQPLGSESFIAISACLEGADAPELVRLDGVEAVRVRGADAEDIRFLAAWPPQDRPLWIAAERLGRIEGPYTEDYEGSSGEVMPCGHASLETGLSIATVLPVAEGTAAIVDDLEVTYTTGGETYALQADVTLGVCASDPVDPDAEHEYCR